MYHAWGFKKCQRKLFQMVHLREKNISILKHPPNISSRRMILIFLKDATNHFKCQCFTFLSHRRLVLEACDGRPSDFPAPSKIDVAYLIWPSRQSLESSSSVLVESLNFWWLNMFHYKEGLWQIVDNKELLVFNQLLRIVIKQVNPLSLSLMGGGGCIPLMALKILKNTWNKVKCQLDATRQFYWFIISSTWFGYIRPSSGALDAATQHLMLLMMSICTRNMSS